MPCSNSPKPAHLQARRCRVPSLIPCPTREKPTGLSLPEQSPRPEGCWRAGCFLKSPFHCDSHKSDCLTDITLGQRGRCWRYTERCGKGPPASARPQPRCGQTVFWRRLHPGAKFSPTGPKGSACVTSPGSPSVGKGMDSVAGHRQLRTLLAPSKEPPEAPARGSQKHCLKQLLKLLCLSCSCTGMAGVTPPGSQERVSHNPDADKVEELC